jgi:hypothetical protein
LNNPALTPLTRELTSYSLLHNLNSIRPLSNLLVSLHLLQLVPEIHHKTLTKLSPNRVILESRLRLIALPLRALARVNRLNLVIRIPLPALAHVNRHSLVIRIPLPALTHVNRLSLVIRIPLPALAHVNHLNPLARHQHHHRHHKLILGNHLNPLGLHLYHPVGHSPPRPGVHLHGNLVVLRRLRQEAHLLPKLVVLHRLQREAHLLPRLVALHQFLPVVQLIRKPTGLPLNPLLARLPRQPSL